MSVGNRRCFSIVLACVKKAIPTRRVLLIVGLLACLTLSSCWDKVELENRGIVVSIGIDRYDLNRRSFLHLVGKEEFNRYTVSAVLPHVTSMRESALSDKSKAVKKADSPTVSGSIQLMDAASSQKLYLSNTKLLVLGNDLLMDETLFRQAIDAVERNRQISRKVYIMSTKERADEVLQQDLPGEPTLGLFMESYYKNSGGAGFFGFYRVLEKIIADLHSTGCTLIPEIEKRSQVDRLHQECADADDSKNADHKDKDKKDEKTDDCEGDAAHVEGSEDNDNNNENTDGMSEEDPHQGDNNESNDDHSDDDNDEDDDHSDDDDDDDHSDDDEDEDSEDEDSENEDSEDENSEDEDSEDDDSENEDSEDEDSEDDDSENSEDDDSENEDSDDEDSEDEDSEDEDSEDEDSEDEDSEDEDTEDDDNNDDSDDEDDEDGNIRLGGCAVIRDYKLVGWLNDTETRGYAWVAGNCRDAEVHVPFDNKLIGFKVHRSRARIRFLENDGKLECTVRVMVRGVVNECNREFLDLSVPANIENFEISVEEFIKREIEQTAARLQLELRADVYNLKDLLRKKNHRLFLVYGEEWDKHFSEMEIVPEIKVDVVSTGVIL